MDQGTLWAVEVVRSLYQVDRDITMSAATELGKKQLQHTIHSSTGLVSARGALRQRRGSWLSHGSRLLNGMLPGRLLIQGRGRGKTGSITSLVGHNSTKQITGAMSQCWWRCLGRASMLCWAGNMGRNGLNTARFKLMSQHSNLRLITSHKEQTVSNQFIVLSFSHPQ